MNRDCLQKCRKKMVLSARMEENSVKKWPVMKNNCMLKKRQYLCIFRNEKMQIIITKWNVNL